MLKKDQILPIGSLVTVFFKSDGGKETIALIVGHLTMQKHMISRYDYTCVAAPAGIEDGLFYINHSGYFAASFTDLRCGLFPRKLVRT